MPRAHPDDSSLRISVLGPLTLHVEGRAIQVPGPKRRTILALLAWAAPQPLRAQRLVEDAWPGEPPASGTAAIQSHISRLRGHLGPAAARLLTTDAGYRLDLDEGHLDAAQAAELLRRARLALPDAPGLAADLAAEGRALWRGAPLADLTEVEALAAWARLLTETWLELGDVLVAGALACGRTADAVRVARESLTADPLREATVLALVRALAADGRRAEAMRTAHAFRRGLREETGLDASEALSALETEVAAGPAPAARIRDEPRPTRTPRVAAPGPLFGRAADLAGVRRLLARERLVTLTGPAGVGKSHLAAAAASQASAETDTTLVHLSAIGSGTSLPDVLAGALELRPDVGDPLSRCARRLHSAPHLLVLDNCEHVLDDVRNVVEVLLSACPELTVLATSRERLALPLELVCPVAPLPMPAEHEEDPASLPSVALFLDRARRVRPEAASDPADLEVVASIVRSLEGVPLAIELAAGRLSSMTATDLAARLDRALDLLAAPGGATGAHRRHTTLRAAIAWSYDLLGSDEQRLLRTLAAFPDGVDLETAEHVAAELGMRREAAGLLGRLVDTSMLSAELGDRTRYRMLDQPRRFLLEQLEEAGELASATRRLVGWAVTFTAWIARAASGEEEIEADQRVREELGNLRAALQAARSDGDLAEAAAIVVNLYQLVAMRDLTEVWRWSLELAEDPAIVGHPSEAVVLAIASEASWFSAGDLDRAEELADRALSVAAPTDAVAVGMARAARGDLALFRGRHREAAVLLLEARDGTPLEAEGRATAALALVYAGEPTKARELLETAREVGPSPTIRGLISYVEGELANGEGHPERAATAYRDAIATAARTGARFLEGIASLGLTTALAAQGDAAAALEGYDALLDRWERTGGWTQQWTTLRNLADLLDRLGMGPAASAIREAANRAPEAAVVPDAGPAGSREATAAVPVDRDQVLRIARSAIRDALEGAQPEVVPSTRSR